MDEPRTLNELIEEKKGEAFGPAHLRKAYVAGYLERELDVREDDDVTRKIAERKAEQWVEGLQHG